MKEFDATAIMIDFTKPLRLTTEARAIDDESYPRIWLTSDDDRKTA